MENKNKPMIWPPVIDFEKEFAAYRDQFEREEVLRIRKAAEQGNVREQYSLGSRFYFKKDYGKALHWWCVAAKQGFWEAIVSLGRMHAEGRGVVQDDVQAHMYFKIASALGRQPVKRVREGVEKKMTAQQIAKAESKATEWLEVFQKRSL